MAPQKKKKQYKIIRKKKKKTKKNNTINLLAALWFRLIIEIWKNLLTLLHPGHLPVETEQKQ